MKAQYSSLFCILFLAFISPNFAQSQTMDQLEVQLALEDSSARLPLLIELSVAHRQQDTDRAIQYARQAIELAKKQGDSLNLALSWMALGKIQQLAIAEYDSALENYIKASAVFENLNSIEYYLSQLAIANTYQEVGNLPKTLSSLRDLEIEVVKVGDGLLSAQVTFSLGMVYAELDLFETALPKANSALQQYQSLNNKTGIGASFLLIGDIQLALDSISQAIQSYENALQVYQKTGNTQGVAKSLFQQGILNYQQRNTEKAISLWEQSFKLFKEAQLNAGISKSTLQIGRAHLEANQYSLAQKYLEFGLHAALATNDKYLLKDAYELLYNLSYLQENIEEAEEYKDLLAAINDFVYKEQDEKRLLELQAKHELEQRENELRSLRQENKIRSLSLQQKQSQNNYLFIVTALLLIFTFTSLYFIQRIRRNNKALSHTNQTVVSQRDELDGLNQTKDKFFSIIAHDLKGPLSSLRSFSNLLINYTDSLSKEEIQTLATDLDSSVKNLFSLLENLLTWARSQTGNLDFEPTTWEVDKVLDETIGILSTQAQKKEIEVIKRGATSVDCKGDRNMITTVIRNLLSNAIKFTDHHGKIILSVDKYADAIEIAVTDNGKGMGQDLQAKLFKVGEKVTSKGTDNEKGTGLGLILCKEFIEKHGGNIWVESEIDKGSTFRFTVPTPTIPKVADQEAIP